MTGYDSQPDIFGFTPDLVAPVNWMGGKRRYAKRLWAWMESRPGVSRAATDGFADLCCGSGAVTLEALRRGVPPDRVLMVDAGPWGAFWALVASGGFDLGYWASILDRVPSDPRAVKPWLDEQIARPPEADTWVYWWTVFQQAAFGAKPLVPDLAAGRWGKGVSFAPYWDDGRAVKRTLIGLDRFRRRMTACVTCLRGRVRAVHADVDQIRVPDHGVVYIDPPYEGTSGYTGRARLLVDVRRVTRAATHVVVSEGRALPGAADAVMLDDGATRRTVSTKRITWKPAHQEWVSWFPPGTSMPRRGGAPQTAGGTPTEGGQWLR